MISDELTQHNTTRVDSHQHITRCTTMVSSMRQRSFRNGLVVIVIATLWNVPASHGFSEHNAPLSSQEGRRGPLRRRRQAVEVFEVTAEQETNSRWFDSDEYRLLQSLSMPVVCEHKHLDVSASIMCVILILSSPLSCRSQHHLQPLIQPRRPWVARVMEDSQYILQLTQPVVVGSHRRQWCLQERQ